MSCWITYTGCHEVTDQNSGRSHGDHVRRADTGCHVRDACGWQPTNKHSGASWRQDGTADVWDDPRHHRANVYVANAGCWRHLVSDTPSNICFYKLGFCFDLSDQLIYTPEPSRSEPKSFLSLGRSVGEVKNFVGTSVRIFLVWSYARRRR